MSELAAQVSSAIKGLSREFEVIVHNLANVGTIGYKRRCNTFSKILAAQQDVGTNSESGNVAKLSTTYDFSQGNSFIETGRKLDVALHGKGFFVIETLSGPLYTRNGLFRINQNGNLVDSVGRTVAGENGPITIPGNVSPSQISISDEGSISAAGTSVGKFKLVDFPENEGDLVAAGLNCFQAPENIKPESAKNLITKQGYQESSNVNMVEELVDMIMVSRLYEANMKFMSAGKDTSKSLLSVAMG